MSDNYYKTNAIEFVRSTESVDMSHLYAPFLELVPIAGLILDAGCGSGRDTKAFLERGYEVLAMDASEEMCQLAAEFVGQEVVCQRFQDLNYSLQFDGIWACASLLHVPKTEMRQVLMLLSQALKGGRPFYMSFKMGLKEEFRNERHFNNYTSESLSAVIGQVHDLNVNSIWSTSDARPERTNESWINALCIKN